MPPSTLGIAPLLDAYFRRRFAAVGLVQDSVALDGGATTVHCWRFPPGASEDLPVLVLLHGFGPPATWQWFRQVGALSARFRLLVPNLLFFGGSRTSGKERSEARQAEAVAQLIRAVVPAGSGRVSVVGTSYGGFVAYHVARLLGAEAVERVVIASSDLLKGDADDRALLRRGGADRVEDVMLPRTPERMRRLMELAYHRPRRFAPGFVLRDIIQVRQCHDVPVFSILLLRRPCQVASRVRSQVCRVLGDFARYVSMAGGQQIFLVRILHGFCSNSWRSSETISKISPEFLLILA
jgi:pimeloyl-ACP methyl ester carboxylesterase